MSKLLTTRLWLLPLFAGLALRLILPWFCHGFRWDDEHWQVIEPANHLVNGHWFQTTEWREGLRSWIYPGLVSIPMRLAQSVGFSNPLSINAVVRMAHGLVSSAAIPLAYQLTLQLSGARSRSLPLAAAWLVAIWPFSLYVGFHTHGEMAGALFVLVGVAAPALLKREALAYFVSGLAFGLAFMLKIDLAVAGLGFGLWQVLHLRLRRSLLLLAGIVPPLIAIGLVDQLTWGEWFHSVLGHARVNLVEGVGNQWGVSPWYTHFIYYFDILGVPALAAALAVPMTWRRSPDVLRATWFMNLFFVAVYATIPHKEKRFLAPLLYTGITAAIATLAIASARVQFCRLRWAAVVTLVLFSAHFIANAGFYLARRPWFDRIQAIRSAGALPGIEKMLSPQWPAVFYYPRHIPAESVRVEVEDLRRATQGYDAVGIATDRADMSEQLAQAGFECEQEGPAGAPSSNEEQVPRAIKCVRRSR